MRGNLAWLTGVLCLSMLVAWNCGQTREPESGGGGPEGWSGPSGDGGEEGVSPSNGDLVVTEFMANGSLACNNKKDWVEVLNLSAKTVSLKSCRLNDSIDDKPSDHLLPVDVGPGEYLLLAQEGGPFIDDVPTDKIVFWGNTPNLNKSSRDLIRLACDTDAGTEEIFLLDYGAKDLVLKPGDAVGGARYAAQLLLPADDSLTPEYATNPDNWDKATEAMGCGDLGTPGGPNSVKEIVPEPGDEDVLDEPDGQEEPDAEGEPDPGPGACDECPEGFTCVEELGVCARPPEAGEIIVTEFMIDGSCSNKKDWVEVRNLTTDVLSLQSCVIEDSGGAAPFDDPDDPPVVVWPDDYLLLVQSPAVLPVFEGQNAFHFGGFPNFGKGGDTFWLKCDGKEMFTVEYGNTGGIPASTDEGSIRVAVQLHLDDQTTLTPEYTKIAANWCLAAEEMACGDKGTAGLDNSPCP